MLSTTTLSSHSCGPANRLVFGRYSQSSYPKAGCRQEFSPTGSSLRLQCLRPPARGLCPRPAPSIHSQQLYRPRSAIQAHTPVRVDNGVSEQFNYVASSSTPLSHVVDHAVQSASQVWDMDLEAVDVVFTATNERVQGWQTSQSPVGVEAVTVVTQPRSSEVVDFWQEVKEIRSRIDRVRQQLDMEIELRNIEWKEMDELMAATSIPRVSNVAARILLLAVGRHKVRGKRSASSHSSRMGRGHPQIAQLAASIGVPADTLMTKADVVITRYKVRAQFISPGSMAALEEEVSHVLCLITPTMHRLCPLECQVVLGYSRMKGIKPL